MNEIRKLQSYVTGRWIAGEGEGRLLCDASDNSRYHSQKVCTGWGLQLRAYRRFKQEISQGALRHGGPGAAAYRVYRRQ